jgi:hypothetical protein
MPQDTGSYMLRSFSMHIILEQHHLCRAMTMAKALPTIVVPVCACMRAWQCRSCECAPGALRSLWLLAAIEMSYVMQRPLFTDEHDAHTDRPPRPVRRQHGMVWNVLGPSYRDQLLYNAIFSLLCSSSCLYVGRSLCLAPCSVTSLRQL